MKKFNIFDIEGMQFDTRRTRVMYGENGAVNGEHFCQGYVVVQPGGTVPMHDHITVETYTILKGHGEVTVGDETLPANTYDSIYMDPGVPHGIRNTGDEDMHLMFVYAPKLIVSHWAQEMAGELK